MLVNHLENHSNHVFSDKDHGVLGDQELLYHIIMIYPIGRFWPLADFAYYDLSLSLSLSL